MVKPTQKQTKTQSKATKTKNNRRQPPKKRGQVQGRPKISQSERVHLKHFQYVKQINQTIGFLTKRFSAFTDLQESDAQIFNDSSLECFISNQFYQNELDEEEKKIYGSKNSLLYWLHFAVLHHQRKLWYPNELLNLILCWFCSQNALPKQIYKLSQQWKSTKLFSTELFDTKDVRSYDEINLFVILAVDIACFQDLQIIEKEDYADFAEKVQQMISTMQVEQHNILMG